MKNFKMKFIKIMLCLVMTISLTGCRFSPVLQRILYTMQSQEIDHNQQQIENNEDSEDKNEDLSKKEDDESDVERTPEQQAVYDEFVKNNDLSSTNNNYNKNSSNNVETSDNTGGGESDEGEGEKEQEENEANVDDENQSNNEGNEETNEQEESDTATKNIVDANGTTRTIPENVEFVTAVGGAATIVEMVAGSSALVGTSANFMSNSISKSLFNFSNTSSWWSGDVTSSISSSNFNKLLASKVDVCFEISGQSTFTSNQVKKLQDNGIGYVVLPSLTSTQNLKDAVKIVETAFGENAKEGIYSKYSNWVDSTLSAAGGGSSCYSLYIFEWRSDVSYKFTDGDYQLTADSSGSGSGVAIAWTTKKAQIMSEMMKKANVTNTSTASTRFNAKECVYVTPMFHQFIPTFSGNTTDCQYYKTDGIAISKDWFVTQDGTLLGSTSSFNKIIVASSSIKSKIQNNYYWKYQLDSNGFVEGTKLYSSIGGNYDIFVAPSGISSWAEGSIESPLMALWVGCKISGSVSSSTLNSKIQNFYSTFFGKSISASQVGAN